MERPNWLLLALCAVGCAGTAHAAPTGLNTIPTTDLIPNQQFVLALQNGNTSTASSPTLLQQPQPIYQSQFGLSRHLEAGMDIAPAHPPHDYGPVFNVKWKPLFETYQRPAIAVGVHSLGPSFEPGAYIVFTKTINFSQVQYNKFKAHHRNIKLRGRRIHAGVIHVLGGTYPMVGADWELSDHITLYSDWISGNINAATIGGVYVINAENSLQGALLIGNREQKPDGFLLNYTRTLKW